MEQIPANKSLKYPSAAEAHQSKGPIWIKLYSFKKKKEKNKRTIKLLYYKINMIYPYGNFADERQGFKRSPFFFLMYQ